MSNKPEYIVELELAIDTDSIEEVSQLTEAMDCFDLEVVGIADGVGPIAGDPLFFIKGKERMIVEMFRVFAELSDDEVIDLMETAHAVH